MKFLKSQMNKIKSSLLIGTWLIWTTINGINCYYQNILFSKGSIDNIYHFLAFPLIGRIWNLNNNLIQIQLLIYLILSVIIIVSFFNQFLLRNNKKQVFACLLTTIFTIGSLTTIAWLNQKNQTILSEQICQKNTLILQTADNEYKQQENTFYVNKKTYIVTNKNHIKINQNAKFDAPLIQISQRKWKSNADQKAIAIYQKINENSSLNQYTNIEINN